MQSMDRVQLLPDDFLQPGQDIVACSAAWLGQAAAACMMKATDVLTEETKNEFGKSSYIGLCLEHLERHRDHEPAAICAISSLQALHTSVLDTTPEPTTFFFPFHLLLPDRISRALECRPRLS